MAQIPNDIEEYNTGIIEKQRASGSQERKVLLLLGAMGSGKSFGAKHVRDEYEYAIYWSAKLVLQAMVEQDLENSRETGHSMRQKLWNEHGQNFFASEAIKRAETDGAIRFIIDGAQTPEDVKLIQERYGDNALVVYIDALEDVRRERVIERGGFDYTPDEEVLRKNMQTNYERASRCRNLDGVIILENNSTDPKAYLKDLDALLRRKGFIEAEHMRNPEGNIQVREDYKGGHKEQM